MKDMGIDKILYGDFYIWKITKVALLFSIILSYQISDVTAQVSVIKKIKFVSKGNILDGQLMLPKNKNKIPLVIFLPGSGETSYRTDYKEFLHQTVEKIFEKDFAILYFDKPGIGKSTRKWWNQNFYDGAENALNAARYAKRNFTIDKSKVFVIGHSQGGWLAQIVASRYPNDFNFGISLSGPAVGVLKQVAETEISGFLCQGLSIAQANEKALQDTKRLQNSDFQWLLSTDYGLTNQDLLNIKIRV